MTEDEKLESAIENLRRLEDLVSDDKPDEATSLTVEMNRPASPGEGFERTPRWTADLHSTMMQGALGRWTLYHAGKKAVGTSKTKRAAQMSKMLDARDPEQMRQAALLSVRELRKRLEDEQEKRRRRD